ncbi:MAG: stress protein [Planctomycetaceae bacterium]|nr:stress protein [Planctomycetaceae bacterium]
MAVQHMVWIRFKPEVSPERIRDHLDNLRSVRDRVPGVVELVIGENFTDRADGYTHGMIVTFNDRASLESYLPHPEHVKAAGPLRDDAQLMAMDIEH